MNIYDEAMLQLTATAMKARIQYKDAIEVSSKLKDADGWFNTIERENAESFQRRILEELEQVSKDVLRQVERYESEKARNAKDRQYHEHPEQIIVDQFEKYKILSEKPLIPGSAEASRIVHARSFRKVCEDGIDTFRPEEGTEETGLPKGQLYAEYVANLDHVVKELTAEKAKLNTELNASNRRVTKHLREEGRLAVRQDPAVQEHLKEFSFASEISDDGMKRIIRSAIEAKCRVVQEKLNACKSEQGFFAVAEMHLNNKEKPVTKIQDVEVTQEALEKRFGVESTGKPVVAEEKPLIVGKQPLTVEQLKAEVNAASASKVSPLTQAGLKH